MKIFVASFVLLSVIAGLNARCVRRHPTDKCHERHFPEPEPKDVHYIYHGETCDCPKYHDIVVEKPVVHKVKQQNRQYEYNVDTQKKEEEQMTRFLFDVRVEEPIQQVPEKSFAVYNYELQVPSKAQENHIRYAYDTLVEQPVQPCQEKPWKGLVAQVDRVLMPAKGCQNSDHTSETCDCGCQNPSHTRQSCSCGNNGYKLPINYNSRYETDDSKNVSVFTFPDSMILPITYDVSSKKVKRDLPLEKNSKFLDLKLLKLKPLKTFLKKDLKKVEPVEQNLLPKELKLDSDQSRLKRKNESPCAYSFESCDVKKHNREGCPLCYNCKCEPVGKKVESQRFSSNDLKIPYKVVTHEEAPGSAPMNQEFDYEPPSYTGLKEQEMYKKYIKQVVSKYPEHMSRKMPNIQDQQQDLIKFIGELANANKSPGLEMENEDIRYKITDDAIEMYKFYEKAMNAIPKPEKNGKVFKRKALEVIEIDPENSRTESEEILSSTQSA